MINQMNVKTELQKFGFEEIEKNIFKKVYCGFTTSRQIMNFEEKIKRELSPFIVKIISSTMEELIIKIDDTIYYDGIVIINNDEAVILDAADQILVSVFENDVSLTDTYGLSEEV